MGRHKQSCQALAAGRRLSPGRDAGGGAGFSRVHKKDGSYQRREIKKLPPLCSGQIDPWQSSCLKPLYLEILYLGFNVFFLPLSVPEKLKGDIFPDPQSLH